MLKNHLGLQRVGWSLLESGAVLAILEVAWAKETVVRAYPDADQPEKGKSEDRWVDATHEGSPRESDTSEAWLQELEELFALIWLRWLSSAVGILVLGVVALTLATSSYRSPSKAASLGSSVFWRSR
jgi:hypothetical protein